MKAPYWKIIALGVLAAAVSVANADVLVFKNGDQLRGVLVEQSQGNIRFNSDSLGVVNVSADRASVQIDQNPAANAPANSAPARKKPAKPGGKNAPTWADDVKNAINTVIPGKISGRLDAGITSTRTNAGTTQIITTGNFNIADAPNTYDAKGFYYYTATRASDGSLSRSADRYGGDVSYRRDFDDRLFVTNEGGYLRDFQANIDHQAQDTVNLGYVLWKTKRAELTIQAGPTERYTDASGVPLKWRTLAGAKQTLKWSFTDSLRLEEDAHALAQVDNLKSHAWAFNSALINQLDRNLELSLRFSQSYNTIVGLNGAKSEQVIALVLGVTF